MMGHKDFVEERVKTYKGTMSEGVAEKDTMTEFGIDLGGRIGMQPRET